MITPTDIKAVQDGTATRRQLFAVLTGTTCGEACWHAKEEVCRCECGGANHGCLLTPGGARPQRAAKIDGVRYLLKAVGWGNELWRDADRLNHWSRVGFRSLDPVSHNGVCAVLYYYTWSTTESHAPARFKNATPAQLEKWEELRAFTDPEKRRRYGVRLLWVRDDYDAIVTAAKERHAKHSADTNDWADKYNELVARRRQAEKDIIGELETLQALDALNRKTPTP